MTNTTTSASAPSTQSNVNPSEVGWQFVPQYYTFVNKHPNRLHCFYTKTSTFIHGTEGEDGKPCYGQQEIHNKITSIGFQDCKVFIHSVDAQSSANGGIIIQVIGEMSNRNDPWRKFVQTFFLAEQPNGYFVLNDIFRFLKEETVDESDEAAEPAPTTEAPWPEPVAEPVETVQAPTLTAEATEPTWSTTVTTPEIPEPPPPQEIREPSPAPPAPVEESEPEPAPPAEAPAPVVEATSPKINGTSEPAPEPTPAPIVERAPTPPPTQPEPPVAKAVSPVPPTPAAPTPAPPPPTQAPPQPSPTPAQPPAVAPPAPVPAPPQPKTWANLAAANSKKWGAAVAQEVRGTTEVLTPVATPSPGPASGAQTPINTQSRGGPPPHAFPKGDAASIVQSIPHAQVFIKGVIETVSEPALRNALGRFGPLKELDIVRSKACAFAEFTSVDHAKKAILASLPVGIGGEGGVRIDVGEGNFVKINVETKKERGERPVNNRGRGGAVPNGERGGYGGYGGEGRGDRGGYRGRGGPRGRGTGGGK